MWHHEPEASRSTISSFSTYITAALKHDPEPEVVVYSGDKLVRVVPNQVPWLHEASSRSLREVSQRIENDLQSVEFISSQRQTETWW